MSCELKSNIKKHVVYIQDKVGVVVVEVAANIDMNEVAEEYRLAHWTEIVRNREASGLCIREYCANAGIHENKYFYWQKKLRKAAYGELALIQDSAARNNPTIFAEVKIPEQQPLPSMGGNLHSNICIETAGLRITAGSEYPIDRLAELFRAVNRACC